MRPISLKLDDDQIAALDTEAEERDLTRSQYLRRIIDARHEIELHSEDQTAAIARVEDRIDKVEGIAETVDGLSDRVRELEECLDQGDVASHEPRSDHREQSTHERAESAERGPHDDQEEQSVSVPDEDTDGTVADTESDTIPRSEEVLADWRPGRNREKRDEQRRAGQAVLEWLRDQEVASAAEFKEAVEPDHPVAGQSPPTWWKKTGREALKHAQKKRLVEFVDGRKEWEWRG